jgi:hypothetical protein
MSDTMTSPSLPSLRRLILGSATGRRKFHRLRIETLESREVPAAFTPGNLVIYRPGDGVNTLVGTGNEVFLDEYTPSGTLVQSIGMPTTANGANHQLIAGGTATAEGMLTRSEDGAYLVLAGYGRDIGLSGSLASTSPAAVPRVIGLVDWATNIDTTTALTDLPAGSSSPRGVTSSNGTDLWLAAQNNGVYHATRGSSSSTQLHDALITTRYLNIFDGQLYLSGNTSSFKLGTVGTGLPKTGGQSVNNLPNFPATSGSPYGFFFADLNPGVAGVDTLYVAADDTGALTKYSLVSGNWTSNGTVGVDNDYRGLTGVASGTTVTLYATRDNAGSADTLVSLVDNSGYNGAFSGTPTLVATAAPNTAFRGVALAPIAPNAPPANNLPTTFSATEDTAQVLSSISVSDPDAGGANISVTISVPAGKGTFRVKNNVSGGVTSGDISGNDSRSVVITASQAKINATLAHASGLTFTPAADVHGNLTLTMLTSDLGNTGPGGAKTDTDTATITIAPVADALPVEGVGTLEDQQTPVGVKVLRNGVDGAEVTHFKVTDISNGTLYLEDGTTPVNEGDFISFGVDGFRFLKFTPATDFYGTEFMTFQGSLSNTDAGLGGLPTGGAVTVDPVADTPSVTNATTNEDTQTTSGLVLTANAVDGTSVTHFKITGITNGLLYKNDGATAISNGNFITADEADDGLKFTPAAGFSGNGSFDAQASVTGTNAGLGGSVVTATIIVNPIADTPSITSASTLEDIQTASGLKVSRNASDGSEVTHFKITNIQGGLLFLNDGVTAVSNGSFVSFANANAGFRFTPSANSFTGGSFDLQASLSNSDAGLGGSVVAASISVSAVADTPSITATTTLEDIQTSTGLVISRNAADGSEVTHFKITNIQNGLLFQNNGTTPILNGAFITFAEANAGLKFTPSANYFGGAAFDLQASLSNADAGLGGSVVAATITVDAVADSASVTNATTDEDVQTTTGLVVSRNPGDNVEVTHFKITNTQNGSLFLNDGTTSVPAGTFLTFAQANAGLRFTPAAGFYGTGSFQVQASLSNSDAGLGGAIATATITVQPVLHIPSVTGANTNEDVQTSSGLVITPNASDTSKTTHFKITNIANGALFLNNGTTAVTAGSFITAAQGAAGLKFTPAANYFGTGSFDVQSSTGASDAGLGGPLASATISISSVNDAPTVNGSTFQFSTVEDTPFPVTGISIGDVDAGTSDMLLRLGFFGTFNVSATVPGGLAASDITNNGTSIVTLTGSLDEINATLAATNGVTYTPGQHLTGGQLFYFQVEDLGNSGSGGQQTFTQPLIVNVSPVNDAPQIYIGTELEIGEDTPYAFLGDLSITVLDPDIETGSEPYQITLTTTNGVAELLDTTGVTITGNGTTNLVFSGAYNDVIAANGTLVFTPTPDFFGAATLTILANDLGSSGEGSPLTATETIDINVVAANDAPSATDDLLTNVAEDSGARMIPIGTLTANDNLGPTNESGQSFSFVSVSNPVGGTVSLSGSNVIFTPIANYNGTAGFDYSVQDDGTTNGAPDPKSATARASFTVTEVNDPVAATDDNLSSVAEDSGNRTIPFASLTGNDSAGPTNEGGQTLSIASVSNVVGGSINIVGTDLIFSPAANFQGVASFDYLVQDDGTTNGVADPKSDSGHVAFTITEVNDAPTANDDSLSSVSEDSGARNIPFATLTGNDSAGPTAELVQLLTVAAVSNPVGGTVSIVGTDVLFTPPANFNGAASFDYVVQDNGTTNGSADFKTATGHVTFTINSVNDQPILDTLGTPMLPYIPVRGKVLSAGTIAGARLSDLTENISDLADDDAKGIAVTGFDNATRGLWEYNLAFNPATPTTGWFAIPANVSASNGLLLADDGNTRVRFTPNLSPRFVGFASLTFKAWDRSNSPLVEGMSDPNLTSTAYSTADDQAWIGVGSTKPAVDPDGRTILKPVLPVISPKTVTPRALAPVFVRDIVGIAGLEAGAGPTGGFGVAITSADIVDGMWRYYQASTKTWIALDATLGLSETNALLLKPTDKLQFTPKLTASGAAPLTFKTWNLASGAASGSRANTVTGSGFGAEPGTAVLDLIPILDLSARGVLNPPSGAELTTNEVAFSSLMSPSRLVGMNLGVTVTATAGTKGRGEWEYSLDGTNWMPIGTRSPGRALFLDDSTLVRFNAIAGATPGSASLSFKAWDMTKVAPGTVAAAVGSSVSRETEIVSVAVGNTAPTLNTIPVVRLTSIKALAPVGAGTPVSMLLGTAFDDVNSKVLKGIAITGFTDNGGGKWQYSVTPGDWRDLGTVGSNSAVLLASNAKVRYVVTDSNITSGDATLSYKAWDRTTGQSGDRDVDTTGALNSFSTAEELATITVTE